MLGAIAEQLGNLAHSASSALVVLHAAVTPAPAPPHDLVGASPMVIVADAERPLDRAIRFAQSLVSGGGHDLHNLHLVALGGEVRRMGAYQPLASALSEFQRHGGSVYVCANDAHQQRVDMMGLVPGVTLIPNDKIPADLHAELMRNCDTPKYVPAIPSSRKRSYPPDQVIPTEETLWPNF